jgi:hypothetical protein
VAIDGEVRVVRHFVVEIESTEPPISEVQLNFLTKPSLKAHALAVAHNQHPQHELRIDRRSPNIAVEKESASRAGQPVPASRSD